MTTTLRLWLTVLFILLPNLQAPVRAAQSTATTSAPSWHIHTGGSLRLELPDIITASLETANGKRVADRSLGNLSRLEAGVYLYHAPLQVPEGATAILRVQDIAGESHRYPITLTEGRAVYLRPFSGLAREPGAARDPPLPDRAAREDETSGRAIIVAELERAKAAGFNTVLVEGYFHGYTLWPTTVGRQRPSSLPYGVAVYHNDDPVAGNVVQTWDPLAVYLEEGHKRGLSVHLWFETFYVWARQFQGGEGRVPTGSWLWQRHPTWFNVKREVPGVNAVWEAVQVSGDGKFFLDPAHPGARAYTLALIREVLRTHPELDGVHLDYIRYPNHTSGTAPDWYGTGRYYDQFGFNPRTLARFQLDTGVRPSALDPTHPTGPAWDTFSGWKTEQVTAFVRQVRAELTRTAPNVVLSAAVLPGPSTRGAMQDPHTWVAEGLLDLVMPMLYSPRMTIVEAMGTPFLAFARGKVAVYPTFYVPLFYDLKRGDFKPGGRAYLSYAARRGAEGTGLFILTGASTGVSNKMAQDLAGAGKPFQHPASPSANEVGGNPVPEAPRETRTDTD